jgi:VanZ family protein
MQRRPRMITMERMMGMMWLRYWGPVWGYAGLIFFLSSLSHPEESLPSLFGHVSDKILHAMEYAVLGGLCYRAFRWGTNDAWAPHALTLAILTASLYGLSDELHQWLVPFRDSSWQDWIADSIGAAIGAVTMHQLVSHVPNRPSVASGR